MKKVNNYLWDPHNRSKEMLTMKRLRMLFTGGINNETGLRPEIRKTYSLTQFLGLILGSFLFVLIYWVFPLEGLSEAGRGVLATITWVVTWWILEVLSLGITSLLPIILLPIFTNVTGKEATTSYADPLNLLFLGGFAIALALERWRLHERIAITVISLVGTSLSGLIIGFMLATGFLSMWVSNTATALLMIPIGTAIAGAILLYLVPTKRGDNGRLLDGSSLKKRPWDVLLLVGGMAIAVGFAKTDLSSWAGDQLLALRGTSYFLVLCSMTIISILMTQVTPNTATGTILLPIAITLAVATDAHPLPLMAASALGAGFAYMMPISTPSNAIIFATGKITFRDMFSKGTFLTIVTLFLILFIYLLFPLIFEADLVAEILQ